MGFNPNPNGSVYSVAMQADGKILLGGQFTTLQSNGAPSPTTRNRIARINADGTLDASFDPNADSDVRSVMVQTDGKIVLGGQFTTLQPNGAALATTRQRIARVNTGGALDPNFDPTANNTVFCLALQEDGKILLAGLFTSLQPNGATSPTTRLRVARVNADGTLDTGFDPNPNHNVYCAAVQADGKILIGGQFTNLQPNGAASPTTRQRIARLNKDGTLDSGFDPAAGSNVLSIAVQADGKVLLSGLFTTLQPNGAPSAVSRKYIARVNAAGTLDAGFDPNANSAVYGVAVQADGRIFLGGNFTTIQPNGALIATARNLFARLLNDPATQSLSAVNTEQVLWTRGGSAPEISQATIESSLDGGNTWTQLGSATRLGSTANWQMTGLSLSTSGTIRARGRITSAYFNGSSSLVEQTLTFGPDPDSDGLLNSWEELYWPGAAASHGPLDDDDHDGLVNLLELAFGLNPTVPNARDLTPLSQEDGYLTMTLTKQPGVTYEVQSAGTLTPGQPESFSATTTTILLNDATTLKVRDNSPIGNAPARFMRVQVTGAP
ncbi:MAG: delta-60 repeat domain-containing protein [Prosthecobacter sp.]|jgi:uncharacterized delta-60 repeat protein|uniref:delta-60 repeat domain-containing protein n=1 Tax=Prosthecobacter sp. TaxID=1965333 RepID=UPI0019DBC74F|nr:delta-60 repeat domain-containing protein [Prosthecobacter sp.]MBE2282608.1 delta-60 repeat domain-containing protein [Prosthecobacter sp.]